MAATTQKTAPVPEAAPAPPAAGPPAITASTPAPAQPWWIPPWNVWLGAALFGLTCWIMHVLAPVGGKEPSQLFNMLAQALVLTAFVGGTVATVYTITVSAQKKAGAAAPAAATQDQPPPT